MALRLCLYGSASIPVQGRPDFVGCWHGPATTLPDKIGEPLNTYRVRLVDGTEETVEADHYRQSKKRDMMDFIGGTPPRKLFSLKYSSVLWVRREE